MASGTALSLGTAAQRRGNRGTVEVAEAAGLPEERERDFNEGNTLGKG